MPLNGGMALALNGSKGRQFSAGMATPCQPGKPLTLDVGDPDTPIARWAR
jgi:hypothetical protein